MTSPSPTPALAPPALDVVERLLDAYFGLRAEETLSLVTDDITWTSMCSPERAVHGMAAMRAKILDQGFGFPEPITDGHHETLGAMVEGDTVMHERVDHFTMRGSAISVPCSATFVVREDRVAVWRDYFDMGTVVRQMTAAGVSVGAA